MDCDGDTTNESEHRTAFQNGNVGCFVHSRRQNEAIETCAKKRGTCQHVRRQQHTHVSRRRARTGSIDIHMHATAMATSSCAGISFVPGLSTSVHVSEDSPCAPQNTVNPSVVFGCSPPEHRVVHSVAWVVLTHVRASIPTRRPVGHIELCAVVAGCQIIMGLT